MNQLMVAASRPEDCSSDETTESKQTMGKGVLKPNLKHVMRFQFAPLIHRMVDKYQWDEQEAAEVFEEVKKFLFLCAVLDAPIAPSPVIDEMWHNFILFTFDYEEFCMTYLGRFIHHRPSRRDDPKRPGIVSKTLQTASDYFGVLSKHWNFPTRVQVDAIECAGSCESCSGGSTNCQNG